MISLGYRLRRALVLLSCSMLFIASQVAEAPAQSAVRGADSDRALGVRLERLWSVGGVDDPVLELSVLYPGDVAPAPNGNLFVLDRAEYRVVELDPTGRRVRVLGRQGMGPGEISAPRGIGVASDGTIHVFDGGKGATVVFGSDGAVLSEYRTPPRLRNLRLMDVGRVAGTIQRAESLRLVVSHADSLHSVTSYRLAPARSTPPVCGLTDWPARPIFAGDIVWAVRSNLLVAATDEFRIEIVDGVRRVRTLARAVPRRRTTAALAREHLGEGDRVQVLGQAPCIVPASMILAVAEVAEWLPAYASLAVSPDGRVWATRYTIRGEPGMADVYDLERGYEGSVELGGARPTAFLADGSLVSIERDADDAPLVVLYAVRRR